MRNLLSMLLLLVVVGCAYQRANTAARAREQMVGMPEPQVLACMGAPSRSQRSGPLNVWTYGPDPSPRAQSCTVNVVFSRDRVTAVNYSGRTGALLAPDEECADAVRHCVR